jgi:hypothetical protein
VGLGVGVGVGVGEGLEVAEGLGDGVSEGLGVGVASWAQAVPATEPTARAASNAHRKRMGCDKAFLLPGPPVRPSADAGAAWDGQQYESYAPLLKESIAVN